MLDEPEWVDMLALCNVKARDGEVVALTADGFEASIECLRADLDFLTQTYRPDMSNADRANFVEDLLEVVLRRLRAPVPELPNE